MSSSLPLLPAPAPANDILSTMPGEIVGIILDHLPELKALAKLNAVSRRWRRYTTPRLYRTVSVQVLGPSDWDQLQLLLRPHIHNRGFGALRSRYRHTWQSTVQVSDGTSQVRRLFVTGIAKLEDPDLMTSAVEWLEQAFSNMRDLQGLHSDLLTDRMVRRITRHNVLKEVGLWNDEKPQSLQDLRCLRRLTYLSLGGDMACGNTTIPTLLLRSAKTLKRLQLQPFFEGPWEYAWRRMVRALSYRENQLPLLSALKELTLSSIEFEPNLLRVLPRLIDFANLNELSIKHLNGSQRAFVDVIVRSLSSPIRPSVGVQLRTLCLGWMGWAMTTNGPDVVSTTDMTRLIASFDTLTRLEIQNYNQFANPPGYDMLKFYPALVDAVIKHKNLKVLKFTHSQWDPRVREIARDVKFPKLSESEVKILVENLQSLEEFYFAPDPKKAWRIGAALAAAPNLQYVGCDGHELWMKWEPEWSPRSDPYILLGLSHAVFKKHEKASNEGQQVPFKWEEHTKICSLTIEGIRVHLASSPRRDFLPVPWEVISRRATHQVQYLKNAPAIRPKSEPIFSQDMSGLQIQDC